MKRCMVGVAFCGLLVAMLSARGAGLIIVEQSSSRVGPNPPGSGTDLWPSPPHPPRSVHLFAPLEVTSIKARTRIKDQVAITSVDQEFYNPNSARIEGTFILPVPKGAQLDKFSMEIDGKAATAELLSADRARVIYEDIVRKLKDPALLEYSGQDLFKARIFPIEPHERKRVTLTYTQLLKSDGGLVSYVLPLSAEKYSCRPVQNLSVSVDLQSTRPLKSIYSPSHTIEIKRDGPNRATASYEAGATRPEADFALYFAPEKDEIGLNLLTHKSAGEDGYFLLLASPGTEAKAKHVIPKDVVFVLDTSGSMAGKKLEQAKKALHFCVESLNEKDRFELLRFSTEVEPLFGTLTEASSASRGRAEDFVKDLKAMGGTAIDEALKKALGLQPARAGGNSRSPDQDGRPFVVIFLTDGCPTVGITDEDQIVGEVKREGAGHIRIFCFGLGTDVNTHLLDKITEETRAFSQYVLPEEDIEVKVSSFFSKIKDPVLTNPKLTFTGDIHATRLYPSSLPDLFKGEQLVLVGRFTGRGNSAVVIEGSVNGEARKFAYDARFSEESSANEFIPRLWATRRVGYLLDEIRLHGENSELRDEVTDLARKYGIVTPYTSYLIVEDEKLRGVPARFRSMQNLQQDTEARAEAGRVWQQFKEDRTGDSGLANALSSMALRSANAPAAATAGAETAFSRRYGLAPANGRQPAGPAPDSSQSRLVQYSQQSKYVAGKTFFLNNSQWLDSAVQNSPDSERVRIQFASTDYFNFLARHPEASAWLALGPRLEMLVDAKIYEIFE